MPEEEYEPHGSYFDINSAPVFANQEIYHSIDEIAENCGFEIAVEESKLTVDTKNESTGVFVMEEGKNEISANGEITETEVSPVLIRDGKAYVTPHVLNCMAIDIYHGSYDFKNGKFSISGSYYPELYTEVYEPEPEYSVENGYVSFSFATETMPYSYMDTYYIPLGVFLENNTFGDISINENGLSFTATDSGNTGFETVSVTVGSNMITVNGEEQELGGAAVYYKDDVVIPATYFENKGFDVSFTVQYYDKDIFTDYSISKNNYPESVPEYQPEPEEQEIFESKEMYYYIRFERNPYIENGVSYIPAYEFIRSLYTGEFSFDTGYLEYRVSEGYKNEFEIEVFSARTGDSFVTVNGKQIELEAPVVEIDNVIQIPVSFAKELGLNATNMYFTNGTSVYFETADMNEAMPENSIFGNNWFYRLWDNF